MIVDKFFRQNNVQTYDWFYEGPVTKDNDFNETFSGSIDTSQIDLYRQGIEISDIKHYDAGVVKIHAGEPGHIIAKNCFGNGKSFRSNENMFSEIDLFDPVKFILIQNSYDQFVSSTLTWPIITKDYNASDNYEFDGIIEPFVIRSKAAFFSIDVPFEINGIRGSLEDGNSDPIRASNQILSIDVFKQNQSIPYLDLVDMFGNVPMAGFFDPTQVKLLPYDDKRLPKEMPMSNNYSDDIIIALQQQYVSGSEKITFKSSDNYIQYNQISSTTGFVFDSVQGVGTDSLTFGGLVY